MPDYEPERYWSDRLTRDFTLRGTGHIEYSEGYNRWLYRAKGRALWRAVGFLPPGTRALDVGSGTGWAIAQLQRARASVAGCDVAPVAVERLRERFPGVAFDRFELGRDRLPHADGSFDLVTLLDVAYHVVDDAAWTSGVLELARVLAPGGRLVVIDRLGPQDERPDPHVHFRSRSAWENAARPTGLRLVRLVPCYRWMSRRPKESVLLARLPGRARGAIEYGLDRSVLRRPRMRVGVFVRLG